MGAKFPTIYSKVTYFTFKDDPCSDRYCYCKVTHFTFKDDPGTDTDIITVPSLDVFTVEECESLQLNLV